MKNILKIIFAAAVMTALSAGVASAQTQTLKIATVDVGKVFTNFWKTKQAQANLTDEQNRIMKDENDLVDNLKKGDAEYKSLVASANDQALSADERDKNKNAADAKLKELQDTRANLDQYDRAAKTRLSDKLQRMHDSILVEIRAAVATKAKAGGYTLVLDSGAQSVSGTPVMIYNSGQSDLTDDIIKQLNIGAPVNWNAPAPAPTLMSPPSIATTNGF